MTRIRLLLGAGLVVAGVSSMVASDRTAIYARIDKILLEPADAPKAIQIWGLFALAKPQDPNDYLPIARGYLYFELAGNADAARKEWSDLKAIAGTGQIVSIGSRYELHGRLRSAAERPERPDPYVVSAGLTKVRAETDYEPVRSLARFRN